MRPLPPRGRRRWKMGDGPVQRGHEASESCARCVGSGPSYRRTVRRYLSVRWCERREQYSCQVKSSDYIEHSNEGLDLTCLDAPISGKKLNLVRADLGTGRASLWGPLGKRASHSPLAL